MKRIGPHSNHHNQMESTRFLKIGNITEGSKLAGPQDSEWDHMKIYKKDQPKAFYVC